MIVIITIVWLVLLLLYLWESRGSIRCQIRCTDLEGVVPTWKQRQTQHKTELPKLPCPYCNFFICFPDCKKQGSFSLEKLETNNICVVCKCEETINCPLCNSPHCPDCWNMPMEKIKTKCKIYGCKGC